MRKKYDWEESQEEQRLNKQLSDIEKEYAAKEDAIAQQDRQNELQDLYAQEKKYINAATKEGKDRLKDIQDQIKNLQREDQKAAIDKEKENRKSAIEQEIQDNKNKYDRLRADLDASQQQMLAASTEFAKELSAEMSNSGSQIAQIMSNIIKGFDDSTTNLIKSGLEKVKKLISDYQNAMSTLVIKPSVEVAGVSGSMSLSKSQAPGKQIVVNITDNGDKNINGVDETLDYTKELGNSAVNALRSVGG
jgi:chromosome segregation ATPase